MAEKSMFDLDPDQLNLFLSIGTDTDEEKKSKVQEAQANQKHVHSVDKPDSANPHGLTNPTASLITIAEQPGGWIGQYKILSTLGEGGMGIVYLAEQAEPIRRKVALKVIKPGMDSKRIIARFEAERQALALLDHPNTAHVYDAGTTYAGRPYFVMEYVKGQSITEHCDHHKLTIEERLRLFQQVCQAVQHAHQKGIIHRDIKPSNILVSMENDRSIPKIIDFGVAKALAQPLTERTLATEDSQLLGTPEYMSPEQADMAGEDIDTRSDIYSLGVLLYVLLTGVLPFDSTTFREGGIENIRKTIRETDPKTPSTRLTKLGDEAEIIAQNRRMEIQTLARNLRKELEWIPLKAMRKERAERYRSASELADDIDNYLKGAPLIAGPPGTSYKLRKFVRRNRVLVGGITAVLIVLVAGIVVSTVFAVGQARALAENQLISDFLKIDVLGSAEEAKIGEASLSFTLDASSPKLKDQFKDKPLIEAELRRTFGETYRKLGEYKKATEQISRAIAIYKQYRGESHPDTLKAMGHIGWVYIKQGKYREMEELYQKLIEVKQQLHGVKHPWGDMHGLAVAYYLLGKYEEAELLFGEILQIVEHQGQGIDPLVRSVKSVLASVYTAQGRYEEAEPLFEEVKAYSWDTANLYREQRRFKEAESLLDDTLKKQRMKLGERHLHTLMSEYVLARLYIDQDRQEEAETLTSESLKIAREQLREAHPLTLRFINARALLHMKKKEYDEAEQLFKEALDGQRSELGDDHPDTLETKNNLAVLYKEQGLYDKAELRLLDAVEGRRLKLGETHPHTLDSIKNLIDLYESWGKPEKANEWRAKLLQIETVD